MVLKLKLDTLDGLSEELAKEYVSRDGAYYLDWEEAGGLSVEDVSGLKKTVESVRGELRTATTALNKFKGIDPDEAKTAISKVAEMTGWDPDTIVAEKMDAREKALIKKHVETL